MQAVTYANGKSNLPIYVQHAAEYYTTGNKRLTEKSFVILSSVTGTTQEVVQAVQEIKRSAQRYLVLLMQKIVF